MDRRHDRPCLITMTGFPTSNTNPYLLDWREARRQEAHIPPPGGQYETNAFAAQNTNAGGTGPTPPTETDRNTVTDFAWSVGAGVALIVSGVDVAYDPQTGTDGSINGFLTVTLNPKGTSGAGVPIPDNVSGRIRRAFNAGDASGMARIVFDPPIVVPENCSLGLARIVEGTSGPFRSATIDYLQITHHPHWDADVVIGALGDSTMWTIQGDTNTAGRYLAMHRVVDGLRVKGASVRLVNFSFGGATTAQAVTALRSGQWNAAIGRMSAFHVQLGMNDTDGTKAAYRAGIQALVDELLIINPKLHIFLHTVAATDRPTMTANLTEDGATKTRRAHFIDALNEVAAAANLRGQITTVVNLHTARSDTDASRFSNTETAGGRIHPNIDGHASDAVVIAAAVQGSAFYSSVLRLTGSFAATTPARVV